MCTMFRKAAFVHDEHVIEVFRLFHVVRHAHERRCAPRMSRPAQQPSSAFALESAERFVEQDQPGAAV